jgi:hypothetical protein
MLSQASIALGEGLSSAAKAVRAVDSIYRLLPLDLEIDHANLEVAKDNSVAPATERSGLAPENNGALYASSSRDVHSSSDAHSTNGASSKGAVAAAGARERVGLVPEGGREEAGEAGEEVLQAMRMLCLACGDLLAALERTGAEGMNLSAPPAGVVRAVSEKAASVSRELAAAAAQVAAAAEAKGPIGRRLLSFLGERLERAEAAAPGIRGGGDWVGAPSGEAVS